MGEDIYSLAFCCNVKNHLIEKFMDSKTGKVRITEVNEESHQNDNALNDSQNIGEDSEEEQILNEIFDGATEILDADVLELL